MAQRPRWRTWAVAAIKLAIVALVAWGLRGVILAAIDDLARRAAVLEYGWLAAASALYLATLLPCALFWRGVLRDLGHPAPLIETLRAYYIGLLGRYVPGKALVVVLRTSLLPKEQGDTTVVAATVFYETLTMMAVGAAVSAAVVATAYRGQALLAALAAALVPVIGLPTVPAVFRRLARWLGMRRWDPPALERLGNLRYTTLLTGWLGISAGWVLGGASLYACLRGLGHPVEFAAQLPLYTASVALATVVGFVVFVLPAGAGVRELVLTGLLARELPLEASEALATAAVLRLLHVVAEVAVSIILYFLPAVLRAGRSAARRG